MKTCLLISTIFFITFSTFSQEIARTQIKGKIHLAESEDAQGISVYNMNSLQGTVVNNSGEFRMNVAINDSIRFSAIQFQGFTVVVDKGITSEKVMNIYVTDVVNELPEVIVSPYDLSGNINVDINRIDTEDLPETSSRMAQNQFFKADSLEVTRGQPYNAALGMTQTRLVNGLNFVNLFKAALLSGKKDEIEGRNVNVDTQVRKIYNDQFFKENLDIEYEYINDFIYYADDNGLSEQMLKEGNELDLIEFLVVQSKKYKKDRAKNK